MSGAESAGPPAFTGRRREARDHLERLLRPEDLERLLRLPEALARRREARGRDRLAVSAVRPTAAAAFLPAEAAPDAAAVSRAVRLAAADSPEAVARPVAEEPDAAGDNDKKSGAKTDLLWLLLKRQKVVPTP